MGERNGVPTAAHGHGETVQVPLATYYRDINDTPLLDGKEERDLACRVAQGDAQARDHLVRASLRLVVSIARRYLGRGLVLEDLIAEGNLGLMRAVKGFDPSRNTRFGTYATFWIKATIREAIISRGRLIRIPDRMSGLLAKWRQAKARLQEELGHSPTEEEVARRLELAPKKLRNILQAVHICNAMPQTGEAFEGWSPAKNQPDHRSSMPDSHLVRAEELRLVGVLLGKLAEPKLQVLRLRFGLDGGSPCTLDEIGQRFGLSRERVRQIEKGALDELAERLYRV